MTNVEAAAVQAGARDTRRGMAALSLTGVLWGSIGVVVRLLQDRGGSTQSIAFWRFVCASAVLLIVLRPAGLRNAGTTLRRPGRLIAVSLGSLAFQMAFFLAVHDVGVATSTLIALGLAPVLLTAAHAVTSRSRPPARTLAVLAVALVGLGLVTAAGGGNASVAPHPGRGIVEALVSGLLYAASTAWSGRLSARMAPMAITLATSLVGVVLVLPVVAVTDWQVPRDAASIGGTAWLALVATIVAYGLFYAGLRTTPGHVAMILTLLEPVTAVLLAAVVLDEPLTIANVAGGLLLLAAICVLYVPTHRSRADANR
jgi:drug/metabolite transporter, DME family